MFFQMVLRAAAIVLLLVTLNYHANNSDELDRKDEFIMSGSYGGNAIVLFGMLLGQGINQNIDRRIESIFLFTGLVPLLLSAFLAYYKFMIIADEMKHEDEIEYSFGVDVLLTQGILSLTAAVLMIVDFIVLVAFG